MSDAQNGGDQKPGDQPRPGDQQSFSGRHLNYSKWVKPALMAVGVLAVVALLVGVYDGGGKFLVLLKDSDVSRGLITFVVALTTVLLAIILALYAITASDGGQAKERFAQGKEVLTTLVGILGTVLGFYFGAADKSPPSQLAISDIKFQGHQVMVHVSGGTPPYRYSIKAPRQKFASIEARVSKDGWILEALDKRPRPGTPITVTVSDAKDKAASAEANFAAEQQPEKPVQEAAASASQPVPAAPRNT